MWLQFCFKLHNGKHLIKDTDKVTLAFHNEEEARLWYTTFQTVIGDLAAKAAAEVPPPFIFSLPGTEVHVAFRQHHRLFHRSTCNEEACIHFDVCLEPLPKCL